MASRGYRCGCAFGFLFGQDCDEAFVRERRSHSHKLALALVNCNRSIDSVLKAGVWKFWKLGLPSHFPSSAPGPSSFFFPCDNTFLCVAQEYFLDTWPVRVAIFCYGSQSCAQYCSCNAASFAFFARRFWHRKIQSPYNFCSPPATSFCLFTFCPSPICWGI